jgi:Trk-type K+ transport system membrane component
MILIIFYLGWHTIGIICLAPWINNDAHYSGVVRDFGVDPTWWSFFTSASLFNFFTNLLFVLFHNALHKFSVFN